MPMHERSLMIVADDFGLHPATDRATFYAAEHGLITGADLMVYESCAFKAIKEMEASSPNVSVGVHLTPYPGPARAEYGKTILAWRADPNRDYKQVTQEIRTQILMYQDMVGHNPWHISSHNHFLTDSNGNVFPQVIDAVHEAIGGENETVIRDVDTRPIRHCRATTLQQGEPPLSSHEFQKLLIQLRGSHMPLELLAHPGSPLQAGEPDLQEDFTLSMRQGDLEGLEKILTGHEVASAGYRLISAEELLAIREIPWPAEMWPIGRSILLSIPEPLRPSKEALTLVRYPWELLTMLQATLDTKVRESYIADNVTIDPTARIEGPVWIGPNVEIGFNAHIIGPTIIGEGSRILDGCHVRHSIIGPSGVIGMNSEVGRSVAGMGLEMHTAKLLDSIAGDFVHFAGQSETANLRVDRGPVLIRRGDYVIETDLPKYGAAVGSFATLGPNSVTYPGVSIGHEAIVGALTIVEDDVPDTSILHTEQTHINLKRRRLANA